MRTAAGAQRRVLGKIAGNGIVTTRESPRGRVWLAADQRVLGGITKRGAGNFVVLRCVE